MGEIPRACYWLLIFLLPSLMLCVLHPILYLIIDIGNEMKIQKCELVKRTHSELLLFVQWIFRAECDMKGCFCCGFEKLV